MGIPESLIKKGIYYFSFDEELYDKGRIEIVNKTSGDYAEINLKSYTKELVQVLFINDNEGRDFVLKTISSIKSCRKKSDKDKYDIGNISEVFAKG